jgi:hypothetical protein
MKEKEKREFRTKFLKSYLQALIKNIPVDNIASKSITTKSIIKPIQIISPKLNQQAISNTVSMDKFQPSFLIPPQVPYPSNKQKKVHNPGAIVEEQNQKNIPRPIPSISIKSIGPPRGLEKIDPLLRDPLVQSVECPGPSKNLIVNVNGALKTTSVLLSKEEIEQIMNKISDRTRIPLMQGVFKAAISNLIVTAVISDLAGSRFHIEKQRRSQMNLPPPQMPTFR